MDVNQTSAITALNQDAKKSPQQREPKDQETTDDEQSPGDSGSWRELDAVEMDGGFFDAVTPEIQNVIDELNMRIEPLRAELERTKAREQQFRELAEHHVFLDVPCRREFLREINHVLKHRGQLSAPPAIIIMHVASADSVRMKAGRHALDRLLAEVVAMISEILHPTDVLGSLGGNDFGAVVFSGNGDAVGRTAAEIRDAVARQGFVWMGQKMEIRLEVGLHVLDGDADADDWIKAADSDLRARQLSA